MTPWHIDESDLVPGLFSWRKKWNGNTTSAKALCRCIQLYWPIIFLENSIENPSNILKTSLHLRGYFTSKYPAPKWQNMDKNDFTTPWHVVAIHPNFPHLSKNDETLEVWGFHPQAFTNSPRLFPVGCKGAHNLEVFCARKSTVVHTNGAYIKWVKRAAETLTQLFGTQINPSISDTELLACSIFCTSTPALVTPEFIQECFLWRNTEHSTWRLIAQTGWRRICKFAGQRFYVWPWPRSPGQKRMPSYDWKLRRFADICTNHQI